MSHDLASAAASLQTLTSPNGTISVGGSGTAAMTVDINFLDLDVTEGVQDALAAALTATDLVTYDDAANVFKTGGTVGQFPSSDGDGTVTWKALPIVDETGTPYTVVAGNTVVPTCVGVPIDGVTITTNVAGELQALGASYPALTSTLGTVTITGSTTSALTVDVNWADNDSIEGVQDIAGPFLAATGLGTYNDAGNSFTLSGTVGQYPSSNGAGLVTWAAPKDGWLGVVSGVIPVTATETVTRSGNVGIGTAATATDTLQIVSPAANDSGVTLTNLLSTSPEVTGSAIGVNTVGKVVRIAGLPVIPGAITAQGAVGLVQDCTTGLAAWGRIVQRFPVRSVAVSTTLVPATDRMVKVSTAGANMTVTLVAPLACEPNDFHIKKTSALNTLTITPQAGATIDGLASIVIPAGTTSFGGFPSIHIVWDGTEWSVA